MTQWVFLVLAITVTGKLMAIKGKLSLKKTGSGGTENYYLKSQSSMNSPKGIKTLTAQRDGTDYLQTQKNGFMKVKSIKSPEGKKEWEIVL